MRIGIMSDSHGDAAITADAVELLLERGASKLFHCGDLVGDQVLDVLAGHDCIFVWGNCDAPQPATRRYVEDIGLSWPAPGKVIHVAGQRIGIYHGHEPAFAVAARSGEYDYLFHGHTHEYRDVIEHGCRVINPGALYRARVHTVACLDLAGGKLELLRVEDGAVL